MHVSVQAKELTRTMAKQNDRKDLVSTIYDDLSRKILTLELEPGAKISDKDICDCYEASRTPVKTALNRLSDEGFIVMSPYQQTVVSYINADHVLQLMYARVCIETAVIKDFLRKDSALNLEDVAHSLRRQAIVIKDSPVDMLAFHNLDVAFHEIWYKAENKMRLWNAFKSSIDYMRLKILDYRYEQDYDMIVGEHEEFYNCIKNSDEERVESVVHRHIYEHISDLIDKTRTTGFFG